MNFKETEAKIHQLHTRVKALAAQRDDLIRKAGSEEQKMKEAQARLSDVGVANSKTLSLDDLQELLTKFEGELVTAVTQLEADVTEGERLLAQA